MAGIAIGVMALIVVLSVMNGFEKDIKAKLLGTQSHIVISHYEGGVRDPRGVEKALSTIDQVEAATPFILSQGLVTSAGGTSGAVIRGIDPQSAYKVIRLKDILTKGTADLDDSGVLIG
ncbi:MAG TPA: ABC transporter permease, partial [Deltaproteobacteria bacterium]|nr:ABC transporter permease [Deltaproteobacteria bacterium]